MSRILSCLLLFCALLGCERSHDELRVGTIAGPESELMETAKQVALRDYGLEVKVVEFSDYSMPNRALTEGDLDANVFQHLPYLKAAQTAFGYALAPIGKTFIFPMGIYSHQIKKLEDLPNGSVVAIPNDPSNEARALLLLQKAGLITLPSKNNYTATVRDIFENPKHLQIKELDAAQLPRSLDDAAIAVINTTYAIPAGLSPKRDALFIEDKSSPYANLIVVKRDMLLNERLKLLVKAIHSPEVEERAKILFGDGAIKAW